MQLDVRKFKSQIHCVSLAPPLSSSNLPKQQCVPECQMTRWVLTRLEYESAADLYVTTVTCRLNALCGPDKRADYESRLLTDIVERAKLEPHRDSNWREQAKANESLLIEMR